MSRDEQPAGGMTGLGIHSIDAIIALAGPVDNVRALTFRPVGKTDLDEVTNVQMRLASGVPVYFGRSIATGMYYCLRVFGTDGWAEIRNADLSDLVFTPRGGVPELISTPGFDMQHAELEAFADALVRGPAFPVPEAEVIHGIEVMEGIFQSIETGEAVALA